MKPPYRTPVLHHELSSASPALALPVLAAFFACHTSGQISGNVSGDVDATPGHWADADTSGGGGETEFADAAPTETCDKMDILFVVDDSTSMGEEQENLAANFPGFIAVLDQYVVESGEVLDYRVAVTTTGRDVSYSVVPPARSRRCPSARTGPTAPS